MTSSKTKAKRPIGVDLFAGAGGLSLGFEQAGFDVVASVDVDPVHCATHAFNFPNCVSICASIVDLTGNSIRNSAKIGDKDIDVVFGGPPCQGFSMIGKRILDDPRNGLVFHFVRLVRELNPKYFVFENVKGLTLGNHKKFLDELIATFGDFGYDVRLPFKVLNALDYGVPQDRRRLFLIGARKGEQLPDYPLPTTAITVADAISDLPDADTFPQLRLSDSVRAKFESASFYARRLRGLERDYQDFGYPRSFDRDVLTSSLRTEHTEDSKKRFGCTMHGMTEPISRFHKLDPNGVCNTLRAGTDSARGAFTSPRPIHPYFQRVITVREAARLHSYPDWFRFHVTKWHGFRQIGNSVPPLLGRAVAAQIVAALNFLPSKPDVQIDLVYEGLLSMNMSEAAAFFNVRRDVIPQRTRKAVGR